MGKRRLGVLSGDSQRPGAVGGTNKHESAWPLSGEDVRRRAVDLADWQLVVRRSFSKESIGNWKGCFYRSGQARNWPLLDGVPA
jgi:hypothetical protein